MSRAASSDFASTPSWNDPRVWFERSRTMVTVALNGTTPVVLLMLNLEDSGGEPTSARVRVWPGEPEEVKLIVAVAFDPGETEMQSGVIAEMIELSAFTDEGTEKARTRKKTATANSHFIG